jgi:hypothetical protein
VGTTPALLAQNVGATARVVSILTNLRRSSGASTIAMAKRSGQWDAALREIAHTVRAQPLKYLQNIRMLAGRVAQAEALRATTIAWIATHRPKLA